MMAPAARMTSLLANAVYCVPLVSANSIPDATRGMLVPLTQLIFVTYAARRLSMLGKKRQISLTKLLVRVSQFLRILSTGVRYACAEDERWSESCQLMVCADAYDRCWLLTDEDGKKHERVE